MSAEFQPPQDPSLVDRLNQLVAEARTSLGRAAATGLLIVGGGTVVAGAEAIVVPAVAQADAIDDALAAYPDINMPCEHAPYATTGTCENDDWGPDHTTTDGDPSTNSTRGYGYRNCTDWVAWRVQNISGGKISIPKGMGDAKDWPSHFASDDTSSTPAAGDIAVSTSGTYGHVAFVESVNASAGTMVVSEYNEHYTGTGDQRPLPTTGSEFSEFINVGVNMGSGSSGSPSVSDGEYIKSASTGEVYIVAGGSPIGLPTWNSVGGTKTVGATLTQAQIDAMPKVPRDGTFVEAYNSPTVYEMAGGAAFGVPSSASVNNSIGTIDEIPAGTSFQQYPNDETFVEEYDSTTVYEAVGDAAIPVPNWSSIGLGDQQPVAMIPDGGLGAFASHPTDGTFIEDYGSPTVYEMAGGAEFGIPTPSAVGGNIGNVVEVPEGTPFPSQPADGTYVEPYGNGTVYLAAAGAAMPISTWNAVGGQHNVAQIPSGGLGQFLTEPRDGTFVAEYGSPAAYEMAGGAAIPLPNWASVGGQEPTVMIPDGDAAGIPTKPANGTFVEPYGSPTVEEIAGGAAFPLASWNQVGGAKTVEQVPAGTTFASLPADGTYIEEFGNSTVAVTAGGAALDITSWSAVGGSEPVTTIPSGAIANDLLAYPENGTYVKGYGTGDEFEAMNGAVTRVTTTPLPAATTVDDWAIVNQLGGAE